MLPPPAFPQLATVITLEGPATAAACVAVAFIAGANLGSFVNVVVHRVPRGRSVVTGRSRCPACGMPVRWHDNIPVVGWLLLRGRCRDCGGRIAWRYPLVEAAGGCLSAVVAVAAIQAAAGTEGGGGTQVVDRLLFRGDWWLVACWLHRTLILMAVLAWAVLAMDGHVVSRTTVLAFTLLAAATAVAVPGLDPPPLECMPGFPGLPAGPPAPAVGPLQPLPLRPPTVVTVVVTTVVTPIVGAAAGWAVGSLLGGPTVRSVAVLVGGGCGWQAAIVTALCGSCIALWSGRAGFRPTERPDGIRGAMGIEDDRL